MRTLAHDTSVESEQRQLEALRQLPPWRKLALANAMNRMVQRLAIQGLCRRFPDVPDATIQQIFRQQRLGSGLATRLVQSPDLVEQVMQDDLIALTIQIADVFEALNIPYLIGGSVAGMVWGEYRSTNDANILAAVNEAHVGPLIRTLHPRFYLHAPEIFEAIRAARDPALPVQVRPSFAILHPATAFKIDVFVSSDRPFERSEFARRVHEVVAVEPEQRAYLATPEDLILAKLEWYELGQRVSNQQWRDIQAMIKLQGPLLDHAYLRTWADQLAVGDLLERAFAEADIA